MGEGEEELLGGGVAMAREWAVKAQESLSKLYESQDLPQAESEELRGLRDFDTQ